MIRQLIIFVLISCCSYGQLSVINCYAQNSDTTVQTKVDTSSLPLDSATLAQLKADSIRNKILNDSIQTVQDSIAQLKSQVIGPTKQKILIFDADLLQKDKKYILELQAVNRQNNRDTRINGTYKFKFSHEEKEQELSFSEGVTLVDLGEKPPPTLFVQHDNSIEKLSKFFRFRIKDDVLSAATEQDVLGVSQIPLWYSLLPPLIAIFLALIFKEVISSLFIGIWIGTLIINGFDTNNFLQALLDLMWSFFHVLDKYILNALKDEGHISVIVFSLLIGGMVAIISRNGGMAGVVRNLSFFARGPRSSQFITWLLGIAIFFDDYANTLIVGNTMRSVTDKYRVSREKLAYIVDSTAAPVAAVALITTWIGAELGYISDAAQMLGINEGAYSIFLHSLQYSFYPVLTLGFIFLLILFGRDYGGMLTAEKRARLTGQLSKPGVKSEEELEDSMTALEPVKNISYHAYQAVFPILTVIVMTVLGLLYTGYDATVVNDNSLTTFNKLSQIIGQSDSYAALLWSSLSGVLVAVLLTLLGRKLSLRATMESLMMGIKTMMSAMIILVLAWALAKVTVDLHTADYLTSLLEGTLQPQFMPVITFLLAGVIAFSTGSSWSTMAILYPLILPTTWTVCGVAGIPQEMTMAIFYNVTASVLAGSVFGDHCSPISDTTILSSLASSCNHIDHVQTQLPYAITVALVSITLGTVVVFFPQYPAWAYFAAGFAFLLLVILIFGRTVKTPKEQPVATEEKSDNNSEANELSEGSDTTAVLSKKEEQFQAEMAQAKQEIEAKLQADLEEAKQKAEQVRRAAEAQEIYKLKTMIVSLLDTDKMSVEEIANLAQVSVDYVQQIKEEDRRGAENDRQTEEI